MKKTYLGSRHFSRWLQALRPVAGFRCLTQVFKLAAQIEQDGCPVHRSIGCTARIRYPDSVYLPCGWHHIQTFIVSDTVQEDRAGKHIVSTNHSISFPSQKIIGFRIRGLMRILSMYPLAFTLKKILARRKRPQQVSKSFLGKGTDSRVDFLKTLCKRMYLEAVIQIVLFDSHSSNIIQEYPSSTSLPKWHYTQTRISDPPARQQDHTSPAVLCH
jgi:hypothetical protein